MPQVLVIDDSEFDRLMVTRAMASTGNEMSFTELTRGEKAVETINNIHPDVVLLDIRMPGVGGFEVLERIRTNEHARDCKVILISGSYAKADLERAKRSGATAYYSKPHTQSDYEIMAHEICGRFLSPAA